MYLQSLDKIKTPCLPKNYVHKTKSNKLAISHHICGFFTTKIQLEQEKEKFCLPFSDSQVKVTAPAPRIWVRTSTPTLSETVSNSPGKKSSWHWKENTIGPLNPHKGNKIQHSPEIYLILFELSFTEMNSFTNCYVVFRGASLSLLRKKRKLKRHYTFIQYLPSTPRFQVSMNSWLPLLHWAFLRLVFGITFLLG